MSLFRADLRCGTCTGRVQSINAHNLFSKRDLEAAVGLMGSVMASGAHGYTFFLHLLFHYWNRAFHTAEKNRARVKGDLKRRKKEVLQVPEMKN